MNDKVIGILGGMGPEATADLFIKIIKATKVNSDQDHFRVIIDNNPKIPDRTKYILGLGENPVQALIQTGRNLEKSGVDIACIPCITAHYFIEEVQSNLKIPILNCLEQTNKYIKQNYPNIKTIGVLSTTGTINIKLFEKYIKNINLIYPDKNIQKYNVMEAIYGEKGIKSGNIDKYPLNLLLQASEQLIKNGAEILISGCTEINLVLKTSHISIPLLDPMQILADDIIKS
ncbi:aspartate/glutamate racemase family protein [Senegalia massiliensis]|jgi:aspartate racemase|uniref:aspartate/glutamate racemase family protein n=1 Tax=Senegalia massiliensis TaxID=1720316 RepID=UPI00102FEED2|nr:amino acid racemase [Senegalia massiliensis]